jgi:uncharacterized membrane protein YidH (DUF202 family)
MSRPDTIFDPMMQHERTALAWERTAIASMVAGLLLARYASEINVLLGVLGFAQVLVGAALLVWSGKHYDELHGPLRAGENPVHPLAARLVGLSATVFSGAALLIAIVAALR